VIWYAPKLGAVVKSSHVSPGDFDFERAGYLPSSIRRRSRIATNALLQPPLRRELHRINLVIPGSGGMVR